jgi:3-dehydroquinate dehydratase
MCHMCDVYDVRDRIEIEAEIEIVRSEREDRQTDIHPSIHTHVHTHICIHRHAYTHTTCACTPKTN